MNRPTVIPLLRHFRSVFIPICVLAITFGVPPGTSGKQSLESRETSNHPAIDGYWKLVDIELVEPTDAEKPGFVVTASTAERNFTTTLRGKDRNTGQPVAGEHVVSYTWSPIPRVLSPQQNLPLTLSLTQVKKAGHLGILQAWGAVRFLGRRNPTDDWGEALSAIEDADGRGHGQWVGGGLPNKGNVGAVTYTNEGTYALSGTGTVPGGSGQMAINIHLQHADPAWDWMYIYDWVDGEPPKTGQEPVPPATTDFSDTTETDTTENDTTETDTSEPDTSEPDTSEPGKTDNIAKQNGYDCLDPKFQQCVDDWLRKAIEISKKYQPELGPWSISPYGHILNKSHIDFRAPDGWETNYRGTRACFVWAEYRGEHNRPDYRGELPALEAFMRDCYGAPRPSDSLSEDGKGRILKAPRVTVEAGQLVMVAVELLRPDGVANMNYNVNYDSTVARPEGDIRRGNLLDADTIFSANPRESNRIRLGFARTDGFQRDGTVAVIPFRATGNAGDCTSLTLEAPETQDSSHGDLPIRLIHGEICIVSKTVLGDCTGDGILTVADAQCALDMSVGLRSVLDNMDMDQNGSVTSGDAQIILRNLQWRP